MRFPRVKYANKERKNSNKSIIDYEKEKTRP